MPGKSASNTRNDIRPWIVAAVASEDGKAADPPWKNAQSAADEERVKRARFLRKRQFNERKTKVVTERLAACEAKDRCLSGACPECGRLLHAGSFAARRRLFSNRSANATTNSWR
jgi:hypothetical protein